MQPFWFLLTWISILWYAFLVVYVGWNHWWWAVDTGDSSRSYPHAVADSLFIASAAWLSSRCASHGSAVEACNARGRRDRAQAHSRNDRRAHTRAPVDSTAARSRSTTASATTRETPASA